MRSSSPITNGYRSRGYIMPIRSAPWREGGSAFAFSDAMQKWSCRSWALHDRRRRRRLVRIAGIRQRNANQRERDQRHHHHAHQVRRMLEHRGQLAVLDS